MEASKLKSASNRFPLRLAGIYVILGGIWIYLSDQALTYLSINHYTLHWLETYKGWGFILLTGFALYLLLRRHAKLLDQFLLEQEIASSDLRKSEERFKTLFEYAPDGIYLMDLRGAFVDGNQAAERITGYGREELIGRDFRQLNLIQPEELAKANEILQKTLMGVPAGPVEFTLQSKNGSSILIELRTYPVNIGGTTLVLGVARDISQRRFRENRILLLSRALEQSNASVMITDLEGSIEYVNPKFSNVTGYTAAEVIGKNPRILKSGENPPETYIKLWKILSSGGEWRGEFRNKKKNGDLFWESASIAPIRDTTGKVVHYLAIKEDITEKKFLEEKLLRSQRLETMGTLASGVAHDLNNVLAPIMLAIEYLKKSMPDERSQRMLYTIDKSSRRGAAIINQILGFVRGAYDEKYLLQIRHVLNETISIIRQTFPRSISLHTEIPNDLWEMRGDPTNIHQLLLNLCINARDALPSGGNIRIRAENLMLNGDQHTESGPHLPPGRYIHLSIADDGIGMGPNELERIYDPFFTTKGTGKGTGLGLFSVKTIVKNHNGLIDVKSAIGSGSVFRIYFPAASAQADESVTVERARDVHLGRGEHILIVDDETSILQITRHILETHGYRVTTASDGTEALAKFALMINEIELVLTDMAMPIMDGPMTIRALRKMKPGIRIIASTGLEESPPRAAMETEALVLLRKPYSAELLLEAVHSMFHGST